MSDDQFALGLDLGGSSVKWGVVARDGKVAEGGREALRDRNPESVARVLNELIEESLNIFGDKIKAVGLGSPGLLNKTRRVVRYSPNFPEWKHFHLARRLEEKTGDLPLALENDANLLVYSETRWGAAVDKENVIVLTLGTGVGGGIMAQGQLITGGDGGAAELGFITINPEGRDYAVNRGCLESYCNINGVLMTAREIFGEKDAPETPEELNNLAAQGDIKALEVWKQFGIYLGIGIATLINVFNPDMVLVGGGISGAAPYFMESTRNEAQRRSHEESWRHVTVKRAGLGAESGMLGAAALAFSKAGIETEYSA